MPVSLEVTYNEALAIIDGLEYIEGDAPVAGPLRNRVVAAANSAYPDGPHGEVEEEVVEPEVEEDPHVYDDFEEDDVDIFEDDDEG